MTDEDKFALAVYRGMYDDDGEPLPGVETYPPYSKPGPSESASRPAAQAECDWCKAVDHPMKPVNKGFMCYDNVRCEDRKNALNATSGTNEFDG